MEEGGGGGHGAADFGIVGESLGRGAGHMMPKKETILS